MNAVFFNCSSTVTPFHLRPPKKFELDASPLTRPFPEGQFLSISFCLCCPPGFGLISKMAALKPCQTGRLLLHHGLVFCIHKSVIWVDVEMLEPFGNYGTIGGSRGNEIKPHDNIEIVIHTILLGILWLYCFNALLIQSVWKRRFKLRLDWKPRWQTCTLSIVLAKLNVLWWFPPVDFGWRLSVGGPVLRAAFLFQK